MIVLPGLKNRPNAEELLPHSDWIVGLLGLSTIILVLLLGYSKLAYPLTINHDCALNLHMAERLISGFMPIIDVRDTNPPMIIYLSSFPVILAHWTGVNVIILFNILVFLAVIISLMLCWYLMRKHQTIFPPLSIALILVVVAALNLSLANNDFGQREHLIMLTLLPFLLSRWTTLNGKPPSTILALLIGMVSGIGAAIKPFFFVLFLIPDVYYFLRMGRRFRPILTFDLLGMILFYAIYAVHFLCLGDETLSFLFDRWLPLMFQKYHVYDNNIWSTFSYMNLVWLVPACLIPVPFRLEKDPLAHLAVEVKLCFFAALSVYIIQNKGYDYQMIPALFLGIISLLLIALILISILQNSILKTHSAQIIKGVILFSIGVVLTNAYSEASEQGYVVKSEALDEYTQRGDPVMLISTSVGYAYPLLVQMDRKPVGRYLYMYPVAFFNHDLVAVEPEGLIPYRSYSEASWMEKLFIDELIEDIENFRPRMIMMPTNRLQACSPEFRMFDYLTSIGAMDWIDKFYYGFTHHEQDIVLLPIEQVKMDG